MSTYVDLQFYFLLTKLVLMVGYCYWAVHVNTIINVVLYSFKWQKREKWLHGTGNGPCNIQMTDQEMRVLALTAAATIAGMFVKIKTLLNLNFVTYIIHNSQFITTISWNGRNVVNLCMFKIFELNICFIENSNTRQLNNNSWE